MVLAADGDGECAFRGAAVEDPSEVGDGDEGLVVEGFNDVTGLEFGFGSG